MRSDPSPQAVASSAGPASAARTLFARITPGRPQAALTPLIRDCDSARPVRAGLYCLNGDWDAAHQVAQAIDDDAQASRTEQALGAHWHALVHRHEPDFSNSKYWLARAGMSTIHPMLADAARAAGHAEILRDGRWDAVRFTDAYADPAQPAWTRELDALELRALLEHCLSEQA
jgi:hypothetical protein